ncbi:FKBP-type peptidyl-prolyl cis-trans isomerase [Pantoea ananatis]|uniref:FKBP-type peptidyl-prolyl cis-trans isomerase n=1 Tax=Pantoea ananas TaxID=553 RepID=UPI003FA4592A
MKRYIRNLLLSRPALAATLLIPATGVLADRPPQVLLFAQQWLNTHHATPARSDKHTAPVIMPTPAKKKRSEKISPHLSCHTDKPDLSNVNPGKAQLHAADCAVIVNERDSLRKRLLEIQKHPYPPQQGAAPPAENLVDSQLREELKESHLANELLKRRYKALKNLVDDVRAEAARARTELGIVRTENVSLRVENKVKALQADIANAELTALRKSSTAHRLSPERHPVAGNGKNDASEEKIEPGMTAQKISQAAGDLVANDKAILHSENTGSYPASPLIQTVDTGLTNDLQASDNQEAPDGDYAAGVALGLEALNAINMNRMLGIQTHMGSFYNGVTDALKQNIRFTSKALVSAQVSLGKKVQSARENMIRMQAEAGKKALATFRQNGRVTKDAQGYWFKIDSSDMQQLNPDRDIRVKVNTRIAGGGIIEDENMVQKELADFPPLFRNVIARLGRHGTATFFVPPELAYGDDGLVPNIPPGASLIYRVTVDQDNDDEVKNNKKIITEGEIFFQTFLQRKDVKKNNYGFWYEIMNQGTGEKLSSDSTITTVMRESLAGGQTINDMIADKQAVTLKLNQYPVLFQHALSVIKNEGALRLVVPAQLAYGKDQLPSGIPPEAILIYDIRILGVK